MAELDACWVPGACLRQVLESPPGGAVEAGSEAGARALQASEPLALGIRGARDSPDRKWKERFWVGGWAHAGYHQGSRPSDQPLLLLRGALPWRLPLLTPGVFISPPTAANTCPEPPRNQPPLTHSISPQPHWGGSISLPGPILQIRRLRHSSEIRQRPHSLEVDLRSGGWFPQIGSISSISVPLTTSSLGAPMTIIYAVVLTDIFTTNAPRLLMGLCPDKPFCVGNALDAPDLLA